MEYRVILISNGKVDRTIYKCKKRETVFLKYRAIKEANNVLFPKKFINTNEIKPVIYKICVVKETELTDTFRTLRDDLGKIYTEKPINGWTILDSDKFDLEETFWIYGNNSKAGRKTIAEVIKRLMIGVYKKKMVKQIIVVHNKLIIYNEDQFDMVICKCLLDAQRLHHTLAKIAKKQKVKSLLFMGTASKATVGRLYDLIQDKTNWSIQKIRRTSTRP